MRGGSARVHDTLGDTFVIEVRDLLAKNEVLEQRGTAESCLERALVVSNRNTLIRGQGTISRIHTHPVERADGRILANGRAAAAGLLRPVHFRHRAGAGDGVRWPDRCPLRRGECGLRIVFGTLVRIEGKR